MCCGFTFEKVKGCHGATRYPGMHDAMCLEALLPLQCLAVCRICWRRKTVCLHRNGLVKAFFGRCAG